MRCERSAHHRHPLGWLDAGPITHFFWTNWCSPRDGGGMAERWTICDDLNIEFDNSGATVLVGEEPVASFRRASQAAMTVSLVLGTGRSHDVSRNPGTISRRLQSEAARLRCDPRRWTTATAEQLCAVFANDIEPTGDLDRVCALLAFPLLRPMSTAGCEPPSQVPAWAATALRHRHIDDAFDELFERAITRGLRRAMRDGLLVGAGAGQSVALTPLAVASTLPTYWPVDRVATVLRGADWLPPATTPSVEQRKDLRRIWPLLPDDIGGRLATESLATPTGPDMLWSGLRLCEPLLSIGHTPPTTIAGLHDLAAQEAQRQRLPVAAPNRRRRPLAGATPVPRRQRPDPVFQPHIAPRISLATPAQPNRITYCVTIELLDGFIDGDYRYTLPRTDQEFGEWGDQLQNCLTDYIPAVRVGRSNIVGQFHNDTLVAALELTESLQPRQFVGRRNRPPTRQQRESCHRALNAIGLAGLPTGG